MTWAVRSVRRPVFPAHHERMVPATIAVVNRDTLTITDNRTGATFEIPISHGAIRASELAAGLNGEHAVGSRDLRPRIRQHRRLPQRDHQHPRRHRRAPASRVSDRGVGRAFDVSGARLPADPGRAAHQHRIRPLAAGDRHPQGRPREREELHPGVPVRRAPDDDARVIGQRAVHLLRRRRRCSQRGGATAPDRADPRQAADDGGVGVSPRRGPARTWARATSSATSGTCSRCCSA